MFFCKSSKKEKCILWSQNVIEIVIVWTETPESYQKWQLLLAVCPYSHSQKYNYQIWNNCEHPWNALWRLFLCWAIQMVLILILEIEFVPRYSHDQHEWYPSFRGPSKGPPQFSWMESSALVLDERYFCPYPIYWHSQKVNILYNFVHA